MKRYLALFCVETPRGLEEFRVPELESLCEMENGIVLHDTNILGHCVDVELPDDSAAIRILSRAMGVREFYEVWARGETFEEILDSVQNNETKPWNQPKYQGISYKYNISWIGKKCKQPQRLIWIRRLEQLIEMKGKVNLKNPELEIGVVCDFGCPPEYIDHSRSSIYVFLGRNIGGSNVERGRDLVHAHSLKKRKYLGTTAMNAEMGYIMSNMAQVRRGHSVLDPFVGTGSLLVHASYLGSNALWGVEIDPRILGGENSGDPVSVNFHQYGLSPPDLILADFSLLCKILRPCKSFLDAIICDPPYGIREAGRKSLAEDIALTPEQALVHYPKKQVYTTKSLYTDLIDFAAERLKIGGRLVYFFPTITEKYTHDEIPTHPCLKLKGNSEQYMQTPFSRRLITMVKVRPWSSDLRAVVKIKSEQFLSTLKVHQQYKRDDIQKDKALDAKEGRQWSRRQWKKRMRERKNEGNI